ncbi:MAG: DEAD/DEAH box helicase [Nanoarchaeota archaeon]|nr:DEAD/DEAH box helicase [Nanoarchaeota archaeon]MBU1631788.1 DEAD/DEAH box helicase [Nanoarchaeota archaeon]MBU1876015.1 DEAD/DEAH box helicase [Nanoarchaeota archaeon]
MKFKTFTLDTFQEDAIKAIENNYSVVVSAPTGSGKTLIADYIIEKHNNDNKRIIYTAPIKALSNQKFRDFSKEYGENKIGLMTGDIVINPHAKVLIMTTEIYRNMVVSKDKEIEDIAYVIFDEIHYINDIERGYVWEESIIYSPKSVRFLCLSATIPNAPEFSSWIQAIKKHSVKTIISTKRNVPLEHQFFDNELGITTLEKIKSAKEIPSYHQVIRGRKHREKNREKPSPPNHLELIKELGKEKLPALFFSFSRKDCQLKAKELAKENIFQKNPKLLSFMNKKLDNAPNEINKLKSTTTLKEIISQGIAFHHAGLLPIIKEVVEELFAQGKINVLYTTETFAVGINMPAKTVCFNSLRKFDGYNFRYLNTKEYFQIAGRAGRRGIDDIGYVVSMIYRPTFNYNEIKRITYKDVEPIKSQFRLSINTVLNLINLHTPKDIEYILRLSFFSYQKFGENYSKVPTKLLLSRYNSIVRKLDKFGYLEEGKLTDKGIFSSQVFADEITLGEIFATGFADNLDEYQILLILASLVYEPRANHQFKGNFKNEQLQNLKMMIYNDAYLSKEKKFENLNIMTVLIHPIYHGENFFDVIKSTNLLEGDVIRIYAQIVDRIGQIKKAGTNFKLLNKIDNCKGIIDKALEGIYLV